MKSLMALWMHSAQAWKAAVTKLIAKYDVVHYLLNWTSKWWLEGEAGVEMLCGKEIVLPIKRALWPILTGEMTTWHHRITCGVPDWLERKCLQSFRLGKETPQPWTFSQPNYLQIASKPLPPHSEPHYIRLNSETSCCFWSDRTARSQIVDNITMLKTRSWFLTQLFLSVPEPRLLSEITREWLIHLS